RASTTSEPPPSAPRRSSCLVAEEEDAAPLDTLAAEAGVRHLVDPGEDERQPEHRHADGETREEERPPLPLEHARVDGRPVQRDAPARLRAVAEAEELESGGDEDRDVEDEDEGRRDAADHVRQELAEDDARPRLARDLRREHEVAVLEREGLGAQDARLERPERQRDDEDE